MPVPSYSRTAANNNSAPPNGAPEGMAPSAVNNTMRQLMKDTVDEATFNACKVLGSVAGTNTITGSISPAITAYSAGMIVVFTPANTNTGGVTLNINSVGALDVLKNNGLALFAGDLRVGIPAVLVLDAGADDWILVNPANSGTFTARLTGFAVAPSGTVKYRVSEENIATLFIDSAISGTADDGTLGMIDLPPAVIPAADREVTCAGLINDSLTNRIGSAQIDTAGVITFRILSGTTPALTSSGFTNGATKGLNARWAISYPLT